MILNINIDIQYEKLVENEKLNFECVNVFEIHLSCIIVHNNRNNEVLTQS